MSNDPAAPTGVDFKEGIAVSDVHQGKPVRGFVGEDPVILVRDGDVVFAVGAHCTHYGAHLADGIVTNGEIRCPWHHACFSLRTGDAVAPPALNALPRWSVEEREGRYFVAEKHDARAPLDPRSDAVARPAPARVVILGAGAAGSAVAETLRSEGHTGAITLIDPDEAAPYDRPNLSKDYLAGTAEPAWLPLRPAGFYAEHAIERVIDSAAGIDASKRIVQLSSSREVPYDALVITTGSTPIKPDIAGVDREHVHVLRSLRDCDRLIQASASAQNILIAGASFIGMEAAASLRARGARVTVVAPEMIPFANILGPTIGSALMRDHMSHGVQFQLGRKLSAIRDMSVTLDDGTVLPADLVLLGIGVRPNVAIAESAGVATDRGVVVNEFLETSIPGIYAAGDIARFPDRRSGRGLRIEHWVVAQRQGQVVARNILNQRVAYASVPFFWTRQYDTTVNYVGHAEEHTEIRVDGSIPEGSFSASFMDGESIVAFASIGRDRESLEVERRMETCAD